jgi:hypothetical protein
MRKDMIVRTRIEIGRIIKKLWDKSKICAKSSTTVAILAKVLPLMN